MKSSVCQSMLHIYLRSTLQVLQTSGRMRGSTGGSRGWRSRSKKQNHPGRQGGEGEARLVQSVTETLSLPLQRAGTPWLHSHQAIVGQSTKLRAAQWWKPSASFNLKLLGWSWHPHKNNAYYVACISSHSPGWFNDNSYLTEHWKLLLHHTVDLSITNSLLGK